MRRGLPRAAAAWVNLLVIVAAARVACGDDAPPAEPVRPPEQVRPESESGERPEGRPRDGERPRGPGDRGPGPSPERFVERALSFDADGDGKLDRAELGKFAEAMMGRMRPRDPERFRREPPPRPGRGDGDAGRERPERPRRPEGDAGPERPEDSADGSTSAQ